LNDSTPRLILTPHYFILFEATASRMIFAAPLVSLVLAAFVAAAPADVYSPPITYPTASTVWEVGYSYNVTWDVSNPPKRITNKIGMIVLAKGGVLNDEAPLATGFSILNGKQQITVPDVTPGSDYSIVCVYASDILCRSH